MGVFGAVFGRRGDAGFNGCYLGARSGVVGFNVATLSRLVREKVRLHTQNTPKLAFLRLLGELFRGRAAEGAVLGEFFRANRPCAQVL